MAEIRLPPQTLPKVYLTRAELFSSERRGHFKITPRGRDVVAERPERIDITFLERFDEFRAFRSVRRGSADDEVEHPAGGGQHQTPEESLEQAYLAIRSELASELIQRVKASSPQFFETLVVDLLTRMG